MLNVTFMLSMSGGYGGSEQRASVQTQKDKHRQRHGGGRYTKTYNLQPATGLFNPMLVIDFPFIRRGGQHIPGQAFLFILFLQRSAAVDN